MYLREFAIGEVLEEGALPDRAVADQYQAELVVEDRFYHLGGARAEQYTASRTLIDRARGISSESFPQQTSHISRHGGVLS